MLIQFKPYQNHIKFLNGKNKITWIFNHIKLEFNTNGYEI